MNFSTVKAITIPEGNVTKIVQNGIVLWQLQTEEYPKEVFDASRTYKGHMSGVNINNSSNVMYVMSVDISQMPAGADVYLDINGFYRRASGNQPQIEKIGFSALENPVVGSGQLLTCNYAEGTLDMSYFADAITDTPTGCKLKVGYLYGSKISGYDTIKTVLFEISASITHDPSAISVLLYHTAN